MRAGPVEPPLDVTHIGSYRLQSLLGRGGMGEVYLAFDERLRRHVALKRIRQASPGDERLRARFRREAQAAARLSHPAIVQIHDILETPRGDCIVMEYVAGETLARLLARGPLGLAQAVRLAATLAEGLGEAHAKGLVHRDLKADNVIITPAGQAKILDFGLARPLWGEGVQQGLTEDGALVGTLHAMSPEQAQGQPVDHRSDVFALGTLLYEMVTGRAPFRGSNPLDTLRRVTGHAPPPLATLRPEVPPSLGALVEQLLEKEPGRRPQSARLVATELTRLASTLAPTTPVAPPSPESPASDAAAHADDSTQAPVRRVVDVPSENAVLRVLLRVLLSDSRPWAEPLGEAPARELLSRYSGLEVEGPLLVFERAGDALGFVLAYHQALARRASESGREVVARVGVHAGEVTLRQVRGAALARVTQVAGLAAPRQTLLTRPAFELARQVADSPALAQAELRWLAHGTYHLTQSGEAVELCEVGREGFAPLSAPPTTQEARRLVALGDEVTLGWRPARGQALPGRPHWTLARRLGEGGFGEVWLATHGTTSERRVFKFCFEAERLRALQREVTLFRLLKDALQARDDIARLLDWNFDTAPYFLESEYTEGGSLEDWAARQGGPGAVPLSTRLELLAQVAEALAATHSVGVLHKDIKPANVLVAQGPGGAPRIRLTDFGIGAVMDPGALEARGITARGFTTRATGAGADSGTPRYLAPERLGGGPATIQADLYALGVMVYQAVVGDFQRPLAPGWQREVEDGLLAEDIAWLVDGDPRRRPAHAREVAERLRTLESRRAARVAEQRARDARERARRRRGVLGAVALTASVMLVGVSVFAVQAVRAREQERLARADAQRRRHQAEALIGFMLGDLRGKLEPLGQLDILQEVGDRALEYFASVPLGELSAEELLQRSKALGQVGQVRFGLGRLDEAARAFGDSRAVAEALTRRDPAHGDWRFALGQAQYWEGFLSFQRRDLPGARGHFLAYLDTSRRLVAQQPTREGWQLELAYAHSNLASVEQALGDVAAASTALGASATLMETLSARRPEDAALRRELAQVYAKLHVLARGQADLEGGLRWARQNVAVLEALGRAAPQDINLQRLLGIGHSYVGDMLLFQGDARGALARYQEYLERARRVAEHDPRHLAWHLELLMAYDKVGLAERLLGRLGQARARLEQQQRQALRLLEENPEHPAWRTALARGHVALAAVEVAAGQGAPAREQLRRVLELLEALVARGQVDAEVRLRLGAGLWLLGELEARDGATARAQQAWDKGLEALAPAVQPRMEPLLADVWARLLVSRGRLEEARPVLEALARAGYAHPEHQDWLRSRGLSSP